jgi:hypothetical protein
MNRPTKLKKRWLLLVAAIIGVATLGSGVFAASQITLNSGNAVSLGAGAAAVNVCGNSATISTQQYFNTAQQAYYTGTISVDVPSAAATACNGKVLTLAYDNGTISGSATWAVVTGTTSYVYGYGGNSGGSSRSATSLTAFNTATGNLATIAVAIQ